jgi:hypothetical protein
MQDRLSLKIAVDTAWSVYRATHFGVHDRDGRRCLLERHLHGRWEAQCGDAEDLTAFGIAYLTQLPAEEC